MALGTTTLGMILALAGLAAGSAMAQPAAPGTPAKAAQPVRQTVQSPAAAVPARTIQPAGTAPAGGTPSAQPVPTDAASGPRITFDGAERNFGVIDDEKSVSHEFKFTNTGSAPLTITNTHGSCGCTVPALEKKTYEPGESGQIKVTYNPANRRGAQRTTVTVTSNDAASPSTVLNLTAEVLPQLMADPQVVGFAQVRRGVPGSSTVKIHSRRADLRPMTATANNIRLLTKLGEGTEVEVGGEKVMEYPLEVTLTPDAEVGPIQGVISIRTSDPNRTISLNAAGEVVGDLDAKPARVQLSGLQPGQAMKSEVRLTSRDGKPFKVMSVAEAPAGQPMFTTQVSEDATVTPPAYVITVTGTAPIAPGAFRGELVVTTDVKGEETLRVPYFGFARAPRPATTQITPPATPAVPPKPASPWDAQPSTLVPR